LVERCKCHMEGKSMKACNHCSEAL
jgi:hypothetical protein